jgi:hypothetical protein
LRIQGAKILFHSPYCRNYGNDDWKNVETSLFSLRKLDYERALRLEKRIKDTSANSFPKLIEFVDEGELPEVDDTSSVLNLAIGSNCYDRQLAIQKTGLGTGRTKIYISNKMFSLLDKINRTGILLHELLLEDYLQFGSDFKRNKKGEILTSPISFLNYLIFSSIYEEKNSHLEYLNILKENNLLFFSEVVFNLQGNLYKISKTDLLAQYPVITATFLKRDNFFRNTEYLEIDYMQDDRRGKTRFSLTPGSRLTLSLSDFSFKEAKIVGAFEIQSSLFEGRTIQNIKIENSNEAYLKFFNGTNVHELTLFKNSDFYCNSIEYGDELKMRKVVELPEVVFYLSSPEYISPCNLILSN